MAAVPTVDVAEVGCGWAADEAAATLLTGIPLVVLFSISAFVRYECETRSELGVASTTPAPVCCCCWSTPLC